MKKTVGIGIIINDVKPNLSNDLMDQLQVHPVLSLLSCSTFTCCFFCLCDSKEIMSTSWQGWYLPEISISPVISAKKLLSLQRSYCCYSWNLRRLYKLNLTSWTQLRSKVKGAASYITAGLGADHSPDMRYGYICIYMIYMDIYAYIHSSTTNYIWV